MPLKYNSLTNSKITVSHTFIYFVVNQMTNNNRPSDTATVRSKIYIHIFIGNSN